MASFPNHSSPFPNALLDTVMPTLKDTEWRLLCVLVRQTLGFYDPKTCQRREVVWLSHTQLKARTGRSSEAISNAIEALVERHLIVVTTLEGTVLQTPEERRRCAGGLFFRLCEPASYGEPEERSLQAAHAAKSEVCIQKTEVNMRKSEIGKAKTIKETETKEPPIGGMPLRQGSSEHRQESLADPILQEKLHHDGDVRRFLLTYRDLFAGHSARGEPPPLAWGRDGNLVNELLRQYGYDRLVELLQAFFASDDVRVRKRGYALSCFPALLPSLLMGEKKPEDEVRSAQATPVVLYSPSSQHWEQANDGTPSAALSARFPEIAEKLRTLAP